MQLLRGEGSEVPPVRRGEASCSPGAGSLREGRGTRREPAWKNVFFLPFPELLGLFTWERLVLAPLLALQP